MKKALCIAGLLVLFAVSFAAGSFFDLNSVFVPDSKAADDETEIMEVSSYCRVSDGHLEAFVNGMWNDFGSVKEFMDNDVFISYNVEVDKEEPPASLIGRVKIPVFVSYNYDYSGSGYVSGDSGYASSGGEYSPPPTPVSPPAPVPSSGDGEDMNPVF